MGEAVLGVRGLELEFRVGVGEWKVNTTPVTPVLCG